jgi:hypothetical protein
MDHLGPHRALRRSFVIGELAQQMEELEAGKHDPPKKVDGGNWGEVDEYEFPRVKVWIQDHARK